MDTIAQACSMRDAGDYASAARLMRAYVTSHPDDPGSARFAALMAYWAKDARSADSIYAAALSRRADDVELRLEYGSFLVETSRRGAKDVLAPLLDVNLSASPADRARAHALVGTSLYWSGDYTAARHELAAALAIDTTLADARQQLGEIAAASAAWVQGGLSLWDDDQPMRHALFDVSGGWFATPLTSVTARAGTASFAVESVSPSVSTAELGLSTYLPSAHLELSASGGAVSRSAIASTDWLGRAALGIRLPMRLVARARFERAPYTRTVRSVTREITTETVEGSLDFGRPRDWSGQLVVRQESFPDDNTVRSTFGWLLAPVVRRSRGSAHVGYGFSFQDASENRFEPKGTISTPPGQAPGMVPGEYNPYYTPENLSMHSALAAVNVRASSRVSLSADARVAFRARDDAPVLIAVANPPVVSAVRTFYERSFDPWTARGSLDVRASDAVRLALSAEHGRGAFYSYTTGRVQLTYTFAAAARRRAEHS